MKLRQSTGWFLFLIQLFLFPLLHFHIRYSIWSWDKPVAYSFPSIQLFLCLLLHFHIRYGIETSQVLIHFLLFSYFFVFAFFSYSIRSWDNPLTDSFSSIQLFLCLCFFFIFDMKLRQSIGLFVFFYSALPFSSPSFSYSIWSWDKPGAYSFSSIQLFLCLCFFFIFDTKLRQSTGLFVFFDAAISFSSSSLSYHIWSWVNPLASSFSSIQLFLFLSFFFHIRYEVETIH